MVHNIVYQADECALHGTYVRAIGIVLYRNDFATFKLHACSEYLTPIAILYF